MSRSKKICAFSFANEKLPQISRSDCKSHKDSVCVRQIFRQKIINDLIGKSVRKSATTCSMPKKIRHSPSVAALETPFISRLSSEKLHGYAEHLMPFAPAKRTKRTVHASAHRYRYFFHPLPPENICNMQFYGTLKEPSIQGVDSMNVIGIIAEYNPFHNGHIYQIGNHTREISQSPHRRIDERQFHTARLPGDFSINGSVPATPFLSGIDLVLELPAAFAVRSAQNFAHGGVSLLSRQVSLTVLPSAQKALSPCFNAQRIVKEKRCAGTFSMHTYKKVIPMPLH